MIDTREYWDLALAVHSRDPQRRPPPAFVCDRFEISKGFFGSGDGNRNGFQAAVYTPLDSRDLRRYGKVLAIAGTQGLAMNDIGADVRLVFHVMPQQASSAFKFYQSAVRKNGRAVIVGHSLGGALAQVLGYWCDCPFVTFNAPGMKTQLAAARWNFFKSDVAWRTVMAKSYNNPRGLNFVTAGDFAANFGKHLGEVIVLRTGLNSPKLLANHANFETPLSMTEVNGKSLAELDPFELTAEQWAAASA